MIILTLTFWLINVIRFCIMLLNNLVMLSLFLTAIIVIGLTVSLGIIMNVRCLESNITVRKAIIGVRKQLKAD